MRPKPRARAVSEAPVLELLERTEELATRWAIGLMGARPLERIADIPWLTVAREAPGLCAQAVRALASDAELRRLTGVGEAGREAFCCTRTLTLLACADDAGSIVHAVEALRGVLWETLLDEMREPTAREVADLADRLAYVCAMIAAAAIASRAAALDAAAARAAQQARHASGLQSGVGGHAVLIDEWEDDQVAASPGETRAPPRTSDAQPDPLHPSAWDVPLPEEIRVARTAPPRPARLDERAY
jgi:hypothetical protein